MIQDVVEMRRFIDLNIQPENKQEINLMINLAAKLGFKGLAISIDKYSIQKYRDHARSIGIDLVSRLNLKPNNPDRLTSSLNQMNKNFEIISVECVSKSIKRKAEKDNRVDILFYPTAASVGKIRFDRKEAELTSHSNCAYEINVSELFKQDKIILSRIFSILKEEMKNALKYGVPTIISSGASSHLLMRGPRELISVLQLLDIKHEKRLEMISTTPWKIIEKKEKTVF